MDIPDHTSTSTAAFEAETYVCAEKLAVRYADIVDTARHLATYDKAAMTVKHPAVPYYNITCRHTALASGLVFARLQTYSVIANVESRTIDDNIGTRLYVKTVSILCIIGIFDKHTVDNQILTHERMYVPCG